MDRNLLSKTAAAMVARGKGLLAADESSGTCEKRFKSVGVECTEANRRAYRDLLFTTKGIEEFVSGVILFDETLRQSTVSGNEPFPRYLEKKGVIPGIKVDKGTHDLALSPGEKVTEGLDGLRGRLEDYFGLGEVVTGARNLVGAITPYNERQKLQSEPDNPVPERHDHGRQHPRTRRAGRAQSCTSDTLTG